VIESGAIVFDGAVVEKGAVVGAGALVPKGKRVPAGQVLLLFVFVLIVLDERVCFSFND
jgi:carbonic anhydrase/acetyltransferase-like protein (isoleucine patch superfamily)